MQQYTALCGCVAWQAAWQRPSQQECCQCLYEAAINHCWPEIRRPNELQQQLQLVQRVCAAALALALATTAVATTAATRSSKPTTCCSRGIGEL